MITVEQMASVLGALPDPAFILSRTGKYVAVFGGRDTRYYHDGSSLVGRYISELIKPDKANWFLDQIDHALTSRKLLIREYELSNKDVLGLPDEGPPEPIWFEGRVQALVVHHEAFMRYAMPTSILIFDLDNFKRINDTQGHISGDEVIQTVADVCRSELRNTDIACRYGGDEFVIALPNTGRQHAQQFAQRLQGRLREALSRFSAFGAAVTASIGVTTMAPEDGSYEDALKRADRALYEAKSGGKDRVVVA